MGGADALQHVPALTLKNECYGQRKPWVSESQIINGAKVGNVY
jgi:hypothetical protein